MAKRICVYCSSSNQVAPHFFDAARGLGVETARQGYSLISPRHRHYL